ncbi:hypothetical protein [Nibricoccus sp. IMCC34717]|uniref:hypothetical protein n=1 Tax=Nibricoccus sp. IMCC34717 TaxID=3034021 RepID=UPI00384C22D2
MPADDSKLPETIVDLRPLGTYDTGLSVLRPDVDSAVEAMVTTGAMVCIYEKRTLMALYKNVSRRNERRPPGSDEVRLWTHRQPDPDGTFEARWQVRLRQPGELFNPFFSAGQDERYGRWQPLVEKLIAGEIVTVDTLSEVVSLGQSFRLSCDRLGFIRKGRMLRRKKAGRKFEVRLAVPLAKAAPGQPSRPASRKGTRKSPGRPPARTRAVARSRGKQPRR